MKFNKILFVATSHDRIGETEEETGIWMEELASPYYIFKEAGIEVTIASPLGGQIPVDPKSKSIMMVTRNVKKFLTDPEAILFLANSLKFEEVTPENFDMVFIIGGHGAMWDLYNNDLLKRLLEIFNRSNKMVGSVCHGVVALLSLQNAKGDLLIKGRELTAFSNSEEESAGLAKAVPFLLEARLVTLGAFYSKGESYISHVVVDQNLITGQNAASAEAVARKMLALTQDGIERLKASIVLN